MMAGFLHSKAWPWLCVLALAVFAFSLSAGLTSTQSDRDMGDVSVGSMLLSEGRSVLGLNLYAQADMYFHRGIPHIQKKAFSNDIFQALLSDISPASHEHATGEDVKEMFPWLRWATQADPGNIEVYLVSSFWLHNAGYSTQAEEVLKEAQNLHPRDYRVQLQKGQFFMKVKRYNEARAAFDIGIKLWSGKEDPSDKDALLDKVAMFQYRGLLKEAAGDIEGAIGDFEAVLLIVPERRGLRQRVDELKSGGKPSVLAEKIWRDMLESQEHVFREECKHGNSHEHHKD